MPALPVASRLAGLCSFVTFYVRFALVDCDCFSFVSQVSGFQRKIRCAKPAGKTKAAAVVPSAQSAAAAAASAKQQKQKVVKAEGKKGSGKKHKKSSAASGKQPQKKKQKKAAAHGRWQWWDNDADVFRDYQAWRPHFWG